MTVASSSHDIREVDRTSITNDFTSATLLEVGDILYVNRRPTFGRLAVVAVGIGGLNIQPHSDTARLAIRTRS